MSKWVRHAFFHPDCDCRLRNYTESAYWLVGYTTGGDLHPALKTCYLLCTDSITYAQWVCQQCCHLRSPFFVGANSVRPWLYENILYFHHIFQIRNVGGRTEFAPTGMETQIKKCCIDCSATCSDISPRKNGETQMLSFLYLAKLQWVLFITRDISLHGIYPNQRSYRRGLLFLSTALLRFRFLRYALEIHPRP